jgi:hypothetical protein
VRRARLAGLDKQLGGGLKPFPMACEDKILACQSRRIRSLCASKTATKLNSRNGVPAPWERRSGATLRHSEANRRIAMSNQLIELNPRPHYRLVYCDRCGLEIPQNEAYSYSYDTESGHSVGSRGGFSFGTRSARSSFGSSQRTYYRRVNLILCDRCYRAQIAADKRHAIFVLFGWAIVIGVVALIWNSPSTRTEIKSVVDADQTSTSYSPPHEDETPSAPAMTQAPVNTHPQSDSNECQSLRGQVFATSEEAAAARAKCANPPAQAPDHPIANRRGECLMRVGATIVMNGPCAYNLGAHGNLYIENRSVSASVYPHGDRTADASWMNGDLGLMRGNGACSAAMICAWRSGAEPH